MKFVKDKNIVEYFDKDGCNGRFQFKYKYGGNVEI